jgi:uncharacterized tellurite resistance protein B-like protein
MSTTDPEALKSLAFLYLTFSHATDGSLSMDEMRAVASRLQTWAPDASLQDLGDIIKAAVGEYRAEADKLTRARTLCQTLPSSATPEELRRILDDLAEIAGSDGTISDEERAFIAETAASFGV